MSQALCLQATVQSGHRIEIAAPELSEGQKVNLIIVPTHAEAETPSASRYPAALMSEYHALITQKLQGALTDAESIRLQDVRHVIAEIDRLTPGPSVWDRQAEKIEAQLAQLRAEIEALPDA